MWQPCGSAHDTLDPSDNLTHGSWDVVRCARRGMVRLQLDVLGQTGVCLFFKEKKKKEKKTKHFNHEKEKKRYCCESPVPLSRVCLV